LLLLLMESDPIPTIREAPSWEVASEDSASIALAAAYKKEHEVCVFTGNKFDWDIYVKEKK
jgi:hypothetical protein